MSRVSKNEIDAAVPNPELQKAIQGVVSGIRRFVDDFDKEFDKRKAAVEANIKNRSLRRSHVDPL